MRNTQLSRWFCSLQEAAERCYLTRAKPFLSSEVMTLSTSWRTEPTAVTATVKDSWNINTRLRRSLGNTNTVLLSAPPSLFWLKFLLDEGKSSRICLTRCAVDPLSWSEWTSSNPHNVSCKHTRGEKMSQVQNRNDCSLRRVCGLTCDRVAALLL